MIHAYRGIMPKVHPSAWIADSADVIGDVELDGAVLEEECVVAAGAVVSPGTLVPRGSLLMGAPARVKRSVTEKDLELIYRSAKNSIGLAAEHRAAQGA